MPKAQIATELKIARVHPGGVLEDILNKAGHDLQVAKRRLRQKDSS